MSNALDTPHWDSSLVTCLDIWITAWPNTLMCNTLMKQRLYPFFFFENKKLLPKSAKHSPSGENLYLYFASSYSILLMGLWLRFTGHHERFKHALPVDDGNLRISINKSDVTTPLPKWTPAQYIRNVLLAPGLSLSSRPNACDVTEDAVGDANGT